jgi:hypothetical protein
MHVTQLAHGKITNADELTIELLEQPGRPAAIRITWPTKVSIMMSAAVIELAAFAGLEAVVEQRNPASGSYPRRVNRCESGRSLAGR